MSIDYDVHPDTRALTQLLDRIRAGHLTPKERHVLAELVADAADKVSPDLVGADAWLRDVIHARCTELLQTGDVR